MNLADIIKRMDVVVIDDSQRIRSLMAGVLRSLDCYSVRPYEDVAQACPAIEANRPALVFCDWKMAVANGGVFLDRIRTHPDDRIAKTPVIIVTGFGSRDLLVEAMSKGATQFLVKPVVPQELIKKIAFVYNDDREMVRRHGRMVYVQDSTKKNNKKTETLDEQASSSNRQAPVVSSRSNSGVWEV